MHRKPLPRFGTKCGTGFEDALRNAVSLFLCRRFLRGESNAAEQLKAENQMLWVQLMNNIRNRAEEVINSEIIYS